MFLEDIKANSYNLRPCLMVVLYRIGHYCSVKRKKNLINNLWCVPIILLYRFITEFLLGYEIQVGATIGKRFVIHHGYAVVINKNVIAGDDFVIRHNVTIGNKSSHSFECPVIGNNVEIGASCILIGNISIGNNVKIAAGSIVIENVPDNSLVIGSKATIRVSL